MFFVEGFRLCYYLPCAKVPLDVSERLLSILPGKAATEWTGSIENHLTYLAEIMPCGEHALERE